MSRTLDQNSLEAILASQTDKVFLFLLTIDHADLVAPIRVVNNSQDIVSDGETFVRFPFRISLPVEREDSPARMKLEIDNVDRQIVQAVRSAAGEAITATVQVVRADAPDDILFELPDFDLKNVEYNSFSVTADLTLEDFTQEPYPANVFAPADFPALF